MNMGNNAKECPLCLEVLEECDLAFFPCACNHQVCRFCWHTLRTDGEGLCPQCWKTYPENPENFTSLSQDEIAVLKGTKRHQEQQRNLRILENQKYLANLRVLRKNLVYAISIPNSLAYPNILMRYKYFGKYGKFLNIVIIDVAYAGTKHFTSNAYITYSHDDDGLRAIQAVNYTLAEGRFIKTQMGTSKYCTHFVKNLPCLKQDCYYIHKFDPEASFTKEELLLGKHLEYEKKVFDTLNQKTAAMYFNSTSPEISQKLLFIRNNRCSAYHNQTFNHFDHSHPQENIEYYNSMSNTRRESDNIAQSYEQFSNHSACFESNQHLRATSDDDLDFDPFDEGQKANKSMDNEMNLQENYNLEYEKYKKNLSHKIHLPLSSILKINVFDIWVPPEPKENVESGSYFNVNNTSSAKWDSMIYQQQIPNSTPQQQKYGKNIGMAYDWAKVNSASARNSETFDHSSIGVHYTNNIRQRSVNDNSNISQHAANPIDDVYVPCSTNAQLGYFPAPVGTPRHANMIPYTDSYNIVHRPIDISMPMPKSIQNQWHPFQNIPPANGSGQKWWHY
ncbi:putative general negative regulator of transcription C16C9.04c [Ctenocephalides felis]|uniref:putative general negative regulator of transcription C16C9.04c n=1 Tax=Ctenocephalides felis TaxID=7515 RepID=UPI000E6E4B05|nr:putative general negative regulator of transcription C16C9.04c [Ctenocephalides felis]